MNTQIPTYLYYVALWAGFWSGTTLGVLGIIAIYRRRHCLYCPNTLYGTCEWRRTPTTPHEGVGGIGGAGITVETTTGAPAHYTEKWVKEKFRKQFGEWASLQYHENYGPDKNMRALYAHRNRHQGNTGWNIIHIDNMDLPFKKFWHAIARRAAKAGRW